MSSAREDVLTRLRRQIGRQEGEEARARARVAERLRAGNMAGLVPTRGQRDAEGRIALFAEMAGRVQTDVARLPTRAAVADAIAHYLRRHNLPQKVVVAPDSRLDDCGWSSQPLLRVRRGGPGKDDPTGVTLALAGIAETGSLMLVSDAQRPSMLAFMPETSIVIVPAGAIVGAYEQALDLAGLKAGAMPRAVNFVTGPSRTADVAQQLELGAHGPKRLLVLIVDEAAD